VPDEVNIAPRSYQNTSDLDLMLDLAAKAWSQEGITEYPRGQLCWEVPRIKNPAQQITLWEDHQQNLLGFALFYPSQGHGYIVHPSPSGAWAEQQILQWSQVQCAANPSQPLTPSAIASPQQTQRVSLLESSGYIRAETEYTAVMRQSLEHHPVQIPQPPAGYKIRAMRDKDDIINRVKVQRAAFGGKSITNETNYAAVMQTPDYRHDLDIIAQSDNGDFVAFCLAWYDPQNKFGLLEPIGTDPAHRKKGLCRAVVIEALNRLQAIGAKYAQVGHDPDNPAAQHAYESSGFRETDRLYKYISQATATQIISAHHQ
jgi:ribosomal protein S18 acetylase RimI-like enzyme